MSTELKDVEGFTMIDEHKDEVYPHEQPIPGNVFFHPTRASAVISVVDVLRSAHNKKLRRVVVLGLDEDNKDLVATSDPDVARNVFLCMRAVHILNCALDAQLEEEGTPPTSGEVA